MTVLDLAVVVFLILGAGFFTAGTVGLVRFPDLHSRLHAVTKADNLGLGLVATGLGLSSGSPLVAVKLLTIWLVAMAASATSTHLIAATADREQRGG